MQIQEAIKTVVEGHDLTANAMFAVIQHIMRGEATAAQIGGFLIGLRMKGESVDEITAAAQVMRELSEKVSTTVSHLVDTCGTGGDACQTFNISTAAAIVAAAAGANVAKHGNRSVSSQSGSADVLEAAGVRLDLSATQVGACIEACGVGFMFAPNHHSAMKHAIGPRREMGVRTIFNLLGPLTNPAAAPNQVMGVFSPDLCRPIAEVLKNLGSQHAMVVCSQEGMDEISVFAPTYIAELVDGEIREYTLKPDDIGLAHADIESIHAADSQASLAIINDVLNQKKGAARDIVLINAGAAIYVAGVADTLLQGVHKAQAAIDSGQAAITFKKLIHYGHELDIS